MPLHIRDATGTLREISEIHVRDSIGTLREVQEGWVRDASGILRQFHTAVSYALSGETAITQSLPFGSTAYAGVRINSDGTIDKRTGVSTYTQIDSATDWIIPNGADKSACRFRCTNNGDALNVGSDSTGSWLSPPCEWYVTEAAPEGLSTLNLSIEISIDSGSSTHDTGVYSGSASIIA